MKLFIKFLFLFVTVAISSLAQELVVQNSVISPGSIRRVNFILSTPVPVRGIELKIVYASDSLQPRWSFWINWDKFPNWISAQNVNNDTDHVALISKTPFQGNARLGSIRVRLAKYVPTGMQLRLNVVATLNDTIVTRYTSGYITAGPVIDNFGDMNEDSRYTTDDANRVLDIAIPDSVLNISLRDSLKADVSGDGIIDTYDVWQVLYRVVNPHFYFDVQDIDGGKGTSVPSGLGAANLILEESDGNVKVYFPDDYVHNGDLSITVPVGVVVESGEALAGTLYKQLALSNEATKLGFVTSGIIPKGRSIIRLRGVTADRIKISGRVNEGLPILTVVKKMTGVGNEVNLPEKFMLAQNYPNPFNPSTRISFGLPQNVKATLKVYDMLGREVATLLGGELSAGNHEAVFDASGLSSGIYIYRLTAGEFIETKRMNLLK